MAKLERSIEHFVVGISGAARWLYQIVAIIAGMSGLFLCELTPLRAATTVFIAGSMVALWWSGFHPSRGPTLAVFAGLFVLRYIFLFTSFKPRGIAARLKLSFGRRAGAAVYEAATALFFFARGVSFSWLLDVTRRDLSMPSYVVWLGLGLAATGMLVNVWATRVVGLDTYYYKDLFDPPDELEFKREGPYRVLQNPMYGVGQLAGYGAALSFMSMLGVLATLANQLLMYIFNWLVEQPHIRRCARARLARRAQMEGA